MNLDDDMWQGCRSEGKGQLLLTLTFHLVDEITIEHCVYVKVHTYMYVCEH